MFWLYMCKPSGSVRGNECHQVLYQIHVSIGIIQNSFSEYY